MKSKTFSLRARCYSFLYAMRGVAGFFRQEHNAWIHLLATLSAFIAACVFHVSVNEMIALLIVTGFVWVAEIFNTVVERMMDMVSTEHDPRIAYIKDLAAGGVLVAALIALITGLIVFIPKII